MTSYTGLQGRLNGNFLSLARELDIIEPKIPDDVYKSNLDPNPRMNEYARLHHSRFSWSITAGGGANADSARGNLANTFVNAFLNAGLETVSLLL